MSFPNPNPNNNFPNPNDFPQPDSVEFGEMLNGAYNPAMFNPHAIRRPMTCTYEGCLGVAKKGGLCNRHYEQRGQPYRFENDPRLSEAAAQARAAAQTVNLPNVAHVPGLQTNLPFRSIPKLDGAPIPDGPPRIHIPTGRASRKVDKDLDAGNILLALSKGPGASDDEEEEEEEEPTAAKKQPEEDASKKRKVEEEEDGPPREKRKKPKIKTECFVKGCSNWSIHHGVCWLHWAQQGPVEDLDIIVAKKTNSNAKVCSNEECSNQVVAQGVCIKHGAMAKICSKEGCDNQAVSAGVCVKHGGKRKKLCKVQGCVNQTVKDGVCVRHGAKKHKVCEREGCTSLAKKGGVCIKHGAVVKRCKAEGCTNNALKGGVCVRHGATRKQCGVTGCQNRVARRGVCARHGAKDNICGFEGCLNQAKKGGRCLRHVNKVERPHHERVCRPAPNPTIVHQASPKKTAAAATTTEVNTNNAAATSTTMHAV